MCIVNRFISLSHVGLLTCNASHYISVTALDRCRQPSGRKTKNLRATQSSINTNSMVKVLSTLVCGFGNHLEHIDWVFWQQRRGRGKKDRCGKIKKNENESIYFGHKTSFISRFMDVIYGVAKLPCQYDFWPSCNFELFSYESNTILIRSKRVQQFFFLVTQN